MVVNKNDAIKMNDFSRKEYCEWCWYKSYGDCSYCSINKKSNEYIPFKQIESNSLK